jgi:RND family efflux transporter MFP subunit
MKKILIIAGVAIFLAACSSKAPVNEQDAKIEQLQQYKNEMHELKVKIENLEKELAKTTKNEEVNVKVKELEKQYFEHFIEVTGTVEAEYDLNVSPETSGIIEQVLVKEGDFVSKGQVIAVLSSDVLERSLDELKVQLDLAETNFQRTENLWKQNIGSEMQYLQAKNNKESLEKRIASINSQIEMAQVKSPINGVVDYVFQKKGNIGSPQAPFARIIDISQIKVYADVSESYLTKVNKGDKVSVSFPALGRELEASIFRISNSIDPNNRTFSVRINLNNPDRMIKPNLVSVIKIRDYKSENAIVIPSLLIKEDFNGNYTYIVEKKDDGYYARKVYVTPGVTNNNMTEIKEGLSAGTQIVSEGFNQIVDGTKLLF